jgi:hypothetical protein
MDVGLAAVLCERDSIRSLLESCGDEVTEVSVTAHGFGLIHYTSTADGKPYIITIVPGPDGTEAV